MAKRPHLLRRLLPAATVGVLLGLLVVPGALGEYFYTDPAGDSGPAPDITGLHVVDDPDGNITFAVPTNQSTLAAGASISVYVDSDRDASTGMRRGLLGVDHEFSYVGGLGLPLLWHYVGNAIVIDFNSTLSFAYRGGLTARIDKRDLDVSDRFRFVVEADQEDSSKRTIGVDVAPDDGVEEYVLTRTPPTLVVGTPRATGRPRAGKPFVVTVPVRHGQNGSLDAVAITCRASVGTTRLRTAGTFSAGLARCAMRLPRAASRRQLRGTIAVSIAGTAPVPRSFAFRIR